jgi:hypothetical protein
MSRWMALWCRTLAYRDSRQNRASVFHGVQLLRILPVSG